MLKKKQSTKKVETVKKSQDADPELRSMYKMILAVERQDRHKDILKELAKDNNLSVEELILFAKRKTKTK
jgi:hypothetical protein